MRWTTLIEFADTRIPFYHNNVPYVFVTPDHFYGSNLAFIFTVLNTVHPRRTRALMKISGEDVYRRVVKWVHTDACNRYSRPARSRVRPNGMAVQTTPL